MALPPEVHSALLSSGPGPGSLLAAAASWQSLSAEYADAAAELSAILAAVHGGVWEGPSATQYVAAHAPYLAWLTQASVDSAATSVQHQAAAAAYTAAVAAMPTLPELAANHITHGVLVATNFLGINTIPIVLNEMDYVRMWIQAATTMATYEAFSTAALAAAPLTSPAPPIMAPGVGETGRAVADATQSAAQAQAAESGGALDISSIITDLLQWYQDYTNSLFEPIVNFLQDPIGNSIQLITDFLTNPAQALTTWGPFLFAVLWQVVSWVGAALTYPQLLIQPLLALTLGIIGGLIEFLKNQLAQIPVDTPAEEAPAPVPQRGNESQMTPVAPVLPTMPGSPTAPTAPTAPASPTAPAGPAPAPASLVPYAVRGDHPGEGFTPTLRDSVGAKAPAGDVPAAAAAAAAASARERRRARRARGAEVKQRGYADEYMDLDDTDSTPPASEPQVAASSRGSGAMGFSGLAPKSAADPSGLRTLPGDSYGGGPTVPLMPTEWDRPGEKECGPDESRP